MKRLLRSLFSLAGSVFAIGLVVLCFRNVFWDDTEAIAAQAACNGRAGCRAQMIREMHTPLGHSYRFVTAGGQVEVTCRRAYLIEGEYACTDKGFDLVSAPQTTGSTVAPAAPPASARKAQR